MNVTSFSVAVGLSTAADTLCSQVRVSCYATVFGSQVSQLLLDCQRQLIPSVHRYMDMSVAMLLYLVVKDLLSLIGIWIQEL